MGDTLLKQPTMVQVLANLQPEKVTRTLLNFPLRRKLQVMNREIPHYANMPMQYAAIFKGCKKDIF